MLTSDRPGALPPETRTVGQLVAETIHLYGRRFWRSLALGVAPALSGVALATFGTTGRYVWPFTVGALVNAAAFYAGVLVATERRFDRREAAVAITAGLVVFVPFAALVGLLLLPGAAWLGLIALAVPAAVLERLDLRSALRRGFELGRADYVHSFGAFAALILIVLLTSFALFFLLRGQSDATLATAAFLSGLVMWPFLFLGGTLLYFDQSARVVDSAAGHRHSRRTDADVHPADDADGSGRPDAEVEPRAAPRGEP